MAADPTEGVNAQNEIEGIIARARRDEPCECPPWASSIPDRLADILRGKHLCPDGEVWGLARSDPKSATPYDVGGTLVFLTIVRDYNLGDRFGGPNEEARVAALKFWQEWQDPETGRFRNPRNPHEKLTEKYLVSIIHLLGGELLYPWTTTGTSKEIETGEFLAMAKEHPDWARGGWDVGSRSCFMAVEIWDAINEGRTDLIPDLERGLTDVLSHMNPDDGFCGPPEAELWRRLGGNLKIIGRVCFKMGMPVPYTREMVDTIIENTRNGYWFAKGENSNDLGDNPCVPRNVAEVAAYCLEASDYRRDELLCVFDRLAEDYQRWVLPDGTLLRERDNTDSVGLQFTTLYGLGIVGAYLHWEDCPLPNPLRGKTRGVAARYRPVLLEDGSVRVVDTHERAVP